MDLGGAHGARVVAIAHMNFLSESGIAEDRTDTMPAQLSSGLKSQLLQGISCCGAEQVARRSICVPIGSVAYRSGIGPRSWGLQIRIQ